MERPDPSSIPLTPGVYLYKDVQGTVIYVGKARCLRKRVLSYFRDPAALAIKVRAMISHAASIRMISTGTEKEALLLESSLIKRHRPHYNIVLRDDKQYVLFRLGHESPFPRLEIVRKAARDGARYFGPFTSGLSARETWRAIHRAFPLRRCSDKAMRGRTRPCLYHDIRQCPAPCVGLISEHDYAETVRRVGLFLAGKSGELVSLLTKEMTAASETMDYERALVLRDQIKAIRATVERQSVVLENGGDMDVAAVAEAEGGLGLGILFVREGKLMDGRGFFWPDLGGEDAVELLWSFLEQFYTEASGRIPPRIVIPETFFRGNGSEPGGNATDESDGEDESENQDHVARISLEAVLTDLSFAPVVIRQPRGSAERALIDMALTNAREASRKKAEPLAVKIAGAFHSQRPVTTVACVDVSHTGGDETRVGVVFFEDGKPMKSAYRTYAIEGAHGDDYAALSMWAERYAARRLSGEEVWPDLILIDGGRGQVASVVRSFERVGVPRDGAEAFPFLLAGIAKARDMFGRADRRAGNISDRIFPAGRSNPLPLRDGSPELLFLQRVRDEAHRFSIGRHRAARGRTSLASLLLSLPGVGPATARRLWDHFKTFDAMLRADETELTLVPGIGRSQAARLRGQLAALQAGHGERPEVRLEGKTGQIS